MQVATKHASAELTKTPTDGKGTFDFVVHAFEIDSDNERLKSFAGLPQELFIGYHHVNNMSKGLQDPGAFIGKAKVRSDPVGLRGSGVLDLKNPMGMAVYERMLLPADDPLALNELSVGFMFDPSLTTRGKSGELVISDAQLNEISVVHTGSQRTEVMNLKAADTKEFQLESLEMVGAVMAAMKAGRAISAANIAKLRAAQEVINELLAFGETEIAAGEERAKANGDEPTANPDEQGPDAELRRQLATFLQ